ncbi:hypothetical protein NQZ68_013055 [Dissostichus eleginoides]|nr:hypothetical protein NQZ68_013055 [Dissostichus eleginoides]
MPSSDPSCGDHGSVSPSRPKRRNGSGINSIKSGSSSLSLYLASQRKQYILNSSPLERNQTVPFHFRELSVGAVRRVSLHRCSRLTLSLQRSIPSHC